MINRKYLIPVVMVFLTSGCESVVDCFDNDGPEFLTSSISDPILNQVYSQTIEVAINNEPRDDNFRYDFTFTGSLPQGVTGAASGRKYILSGTPIEQGTHQFSLFVEIDDNLDVSESGLCFYTASRTYEFTVQPL